MAAASTTAPPAAVLFLFLSLLAVAVSASASSVSNNNNNTTTNHDNNQDDEELVGWIATFIATVCYGSYGVPIKETLDINVHPFIMQSYKTVTMFVMVWFVPTLFGIDPQFTYWGLVSGLLWVIGGSCGVYAIRAAGMAVAVGTWASVMICVNFIWGVLIFKEPVNNLTSAIGAFACLGIGVVGMSIFSSQPKKLKDVPVTPLLPPITEMKKEKQLMENNGGGGTELVPLVVEVQEIMVPKLRRSASDQQQQPADEDQDGKTETNMNNETTVNGQVSMNIEQPSTVASSATDSVVASPVVVVPPRIPGFSLRASGIVAAICNGVFAGSSLIPVHFAKSQGLGGANYLISFACGSFIANTILWILYFMYVCYNNYYVIEKQQQSDIISTSYESILLHAYSKMPSWHFRKLWLKGIIAGAILSIAMFGSIISVTYLGQAVGNSCIQSKILISGLWGIFWYREITGCTTITRWFGSASIAVLGIIWLSQERRIAATKSG